MLGELMEDLKGTEAREKASLGGDATVGEYSRLPRVNLNSSEVPPVICHVGGPGTTDPIAARLERSRWGLRLALDRFLQVLSIRT